MIIRVRCNHVFDKETVVAIMEISLMAPKTARMGLEKLVDVHRRRIPPPLVSNLTSKVCEFILEAIRSGKLTPGAKIVEAQVAEELSISPVPVREAMARLEQEGWVERIPNRGAFVKKMGIADIQYLFELREILETAAVEKIAESITSQQLDELKQVMELVETARQTKEEGVAREADTHFHRLLIHFAGNPRMELMFESILLQASGAFFRLAEDYPFFVKEIRKGLRSADHRHIYDALAEHDARKAVKYVREHHKMSCKTAIAIEKFLSSFVEGQKGLG